MTMSEQKNTFSKTIYHSFLASCSSSHAAFILCSAITWSNSRCWASRRLRNLSCSVSPGWVLSIGAGRRSSTGETGRSGDDGHGTWRRASSSDRNETNIGSWCPPRGSGVLRLFGGEICGAVAARVVGRSVWTVWIAAGWCCAATCAVSLTVTGGGGGGGDSGAGWAGTRDKLRFGELKRDSASKPAWVKKES